MPYCFNADIFGSKHFKPTKSFVLYIIEVLTWIGVQGEISAALRSDLLHPGEKVSNDVIKPSDL